VPIRITGHMRLVGPAGAAEASDLPGRQGRLVLAALGLAERAVAREVLAERVWGDAPTRSWERDLSALVSKLRAVLARTGLEGAATIHSDGASYELEAGPGAEIDVRRARAAADELEAADATGSHAAAAEAAAEVLEVTARPLLAGEDAPWIDEARAELARLRVRALDGAARADLARGLEDAARERVREALELEPFRESTHRLLMDVELAAGNRGEAVRAYERLRELLAGELGVDPSPESEARYLEALRVAAAPAATATASAAASSPAPAPPDVPPIRYARSGKVNIAYQVVGTGPVDLVMVPGWVSNLELAWHEPRMAGFLRRLADHCRLILFDKRGTGCPTPCRSTSPRRSRCAWTTSAR
jgi:SARP family transcriptional regulator, regulator of embCAB operon